MRSKIKSNPLYRNKWDWVIDGPLPQLFLFREKKDKISKEVIIYDLAMAG